jgi:multidrug resistance efflux pump
MTEMRSPTGLEGASVPAADPLDRPLDAAPAAGHESEEAKLWTEFTGAASRAAYCRAWLALQCRMIPSASAALLLIAEEDAFAPAAIWPDRRRDVSYLKTVAEKVLTERAGAIVRVPDAQGGGPDEGRRSDIHVGYPVLARGTLYGAVVVHVKARDDADLKASLRQLHWGIGWLEALFWQSRAGDDKLRLERAAVALDVLAATQEEAKLRAAAMACANELVARLACDRVAIGWKRGNAVRLKAMSHQTQVERRARFVDALENAMDEAFDQNASVCHPQADGVPNRVSVALRSFGGANGFASALSVVMPAGGGAFGVITLMRREGKPFDAEAVHLAEAVAALVGPVLEQKVRGNRWLSGRLVDGPAGVLGALFGRRHPTLKLAVLAVAGLVAWLAVATGSFQLSAKSLVEAQVQRAAVAPFDGYIAEAGVRAGEAVKAGQLLAVLDDKDLRLDSLKWRTEKDKALQKMREASADHDRAGIATYSAQAKQADAQYALAAEMLERTRVVAPIDGVVVSGDLSQMLGSPVERGKVLFEIAPLASYRVILQIGESDLRYVWLGQAGTLALVGRPDVALPFTVSRITSIASADEGVNHFRVEATLTEDNATLRPGMEGVARLDVGERSLFWIGTHNLVDWLKLTWWAWKPL